MPSPAFVPGTTLGDYRLIEPDSAGSGVSWIAERIDSGQTVSLRIFPRSLPPDPARRTAVVDAIASKLPIEHPSIVSVRSVSAHEDALVIEMVKASGASLASLTEPLNAAEIVPLAASLIAALEALHSKGIVHGTLSAARVRKVGERWMVAEINPSALLGRPDRGEARLLAATDTAAADELRWRAPEQLSNQRIDRRSDIFALGAILYRAATGIEPFTGSTPEETVTTVLRASPRPPQELNPGLPPALVALIGACLRKDPARRPQTASTLMDELTRIDPAAKSFSARLSSTQDTVFLVAEIPYIEMLERSQPRKAMRNSARMQQFVSEAVLLLDGQVLDSLGNRVIATLPSSEAALSAVRQAADAIAEHNRSADPDEVIEPAMLVHRGTVVMEGATARGRELEVAQRVIPSLEPGQILISASVLRDTELEGHLSRAGAIEGIEFHALSTPTKIEPAASPDPPVVAAGAPAESASPSARSFSPVMIGVLALVAIAVLGAAAIFLFRESSKPASADASAAPVATPDATAALGPVVFLGSFTEGLEQPELVARGAAIEAALRRMLASIPELQIAARPSSEARQYGARAAEGEPGLVAFSSSGDGPRVALSDPAAATAALAAWIAGNAGVTAPAGRPEAIAPFIEAVQQFEAGNGSQAMEALRRSTAVDPDFPAAQILAFEISSSSGDVPAALAAGEAILRTRPADHAVRARLFDWYRSSRDISSAIRHAIVLAENDEGDAEVIQFLARRALSAGDEAAFGAIFPRLEKLEGSSSPLHRPDILSAQGRFANAAQQYYQIEPSQPENPWLAFKIGRIAIMRHSTSVAEFEIEKLSRLEPRYLHPLLEAYLAAGRRDRAGAAAALEKAAAGATPEDAFHTASAEIWAILTDHQQIVASLRRANEAREPTCASILSNPLFAYLNDDRDFAPVRAEIARRRSETLQALAPLQ